MFNIIPDDYKKQLLDIQKITSSDDGTELVILKLSRDQHLRFKKLAPLIIDDVRQSLYAEYNGKYFHIGGNSHIADKINNNIFNISPASSKYTENKNFYKELRRISPTGKTRNSIIINTHCGIIPIHLHKMYNRLYCVDKLKIEQKESLLNLKSNKVNNCMSFETDYSTWIDDFIKHKYSPPGKKNKIGLVVLDTSVIDSTKVLDIVGINSETIILHSKDLEKIEEVLAIITQKDGFRLTLAEKVEQIHLRRIKNDNDL